MSIKFYTLTQISRPEFLFTLPKFSTKFKMELSFGNFRFYFSKIINAAVPGKVPPISPEAINLHPATAYHKIENLNLAISSARSIGCTVVNIRPEFILEKR